MLNEDYENLMRACSLGNIKDIAYYLSKGSYINGLNVKNSRINYAPIFIAIYNNNLLVLEYLLKNNANPNLILDIDSPLHVLTLSEIEDFGGGFIKNLNSFSTELLIKFGANVNLSNKYGYTPLDYAISYKHYLAEKVLRKNNAKNSKIYVYGYNYKKYPTEILNNIDYIDTNFDEKIVVEFLPRYHSEIKITLEEENIRGKIDKTYLGRLTKYPEYINEIDYKKRTPLDYAIEKNHIIAQNILLNNGGKTFKQLLDEGNPYIINCLMEEEKDLNNDTLPSF